VVTYVTHTKLVTSVCKWLLMWRLWPPTLHEKKIIFFNNNHILHRLDDLTGVITLPELVTQPQVPPHILTHAKLVTRVSVSGYLCDVYGHPLFMKKTNFFNKNHILHWLDDLTGVITLLWLVTQPHVPPHILAHAKLVTRVSVSSYLRDVYDSPILYEKKSIFLWAIYYTG